MAAILFRAVPSAIIIRALAAYSSCCGASQRVSPRAMLSCLYCCRAQCWVLSSAFASPPPGLGAASDRAERRIRLPFPAATGGRAARITPPELPQHLAAVRRPSRPPRPLPTRQQRTRPECRLDELPEKIAASGLLVAPEEDSF